MKAAALDLRNSCGVASIWWSHEKGSFEAEVTTERIEKSFCYEIDA